MIIFVLGNMASGKTTLSKKIEELYPSFKHLDLDEFRRKYNTGKTLDGEKTAQRMFINAIRNNKNVIIDVTGTGRFFSEYFQKDVHNQAYVILLNSSIEDCKKRQLQRLNSGYKMPPLPSNWNISFEDGLKFMSSILSYMRHDLKLDANDTIENKIAKIKCLVNFKA